MKKLKILVLYEKDLITATFSIKFKVIHPPTPLYKYARDARCLFIICVIVYNLYYCCYSKTSSSAVQKRHSKVHGNPIAPSFYSISSCLQQIQCTIYYRVSHDTEFTFNRFKVQFIKGCPIIQSLYSTHSRYNLLQGVS